jgi:hypothetical protein
VVVSLAWLVPAKADAGSVAWFGGEVVVLEDRWIAAGSTRGVPARKGWMPGALGVSAMSAMCQGVYLLVKQLNVNVSSSEWQLVGE